MGYNGESGNGTDALGNPYDPNKNTIYLTEDAMFAIDVAHGFGDRIPGQEDLTPHGLLDFLLGIIETKPDPQHVKDPDGTIKFSLCHAPKYARTRTLAYRQCKRYFVEQSFREGKMELGLNEYQTRSEPGWIRHMALCILTQLFINTEKLRHKTRNRLKLSAGDILRLIQCKTVFYENDIDKLFRMILRKQPFRQRSLENLFNLRI
jgi:hypothetical protein